MSDDDVTQDVIPIMEDTRKWVRIKALLFRVIDQEELLSFLAKHWPTHAPRQAEVAALEQRIRVLEREVEQRGEAIKAKNEYIRTFQQGERK